MHSTGLKDHHIIEVRGLNYTYPLGEAIFEDLSYELFAGDFHVIFGKNGSGKSTFLQVLLGYRTPESGSIKILGKEFSRDDTFFREKVGYISQSFEIPNELTISEFLEFNQIICGNVIPEREAELLKIFDLNPEKLISELSTGQKRKVFTAATLSRDCACFVIDEITAVLDPPTREDLISFLTYLCKEKEVAVLLATNIKDDIKEAVSQVYMVENQQLHFTKKAFAGGDE
ncbi:MAG: ABC transporter ATP-binding protein [Halobacteriovoraceae bacterium]|nr:ABC transporter ATP-binding protein [Halobacteriovoraceae bacterium]